MNVYQFKCLLAMTAVFAGTFLYALEKEPDKMITGYVIEVNSDQTLVIDLGRSKGIIIDDEFVIYSHDKLVRHPITQEEIRVPGEEIAKALVKDVYDTFAILSIDTASIKSKTAIEPGFSVKFLPRENSNLKSIMKRNKLKTDLKKSETTVKSASSTGYFGDVTVLNESFFVGYKFPTRLDYFCFELQLSQFLQIYDIYDPQYELSSLIHAYANIVFHFEIWQQKGDNGGIGLIMGGGFTQTGFAGNAGIIIGNMNKTGLSVYFYGLWNKSITTEMNLTILMFSLKNVGMNMDSQIQYSYWFGESERIRHGLMFSFGPSVRLGEYVYLNAFGGVTNTASQDFGGVGGLGIKMVF